MTQEENTGEWQVYCLSLLEVMRSQNAQQWGPTMVRFYQIPLQLMGPVWSKAACEYAVQECPWRPQPADLLAMAAKMASPLPPVGELWQEFRHKLLHAEHKRPSWTHPVVADIAATLGGWSELYGAFWPDTHGKTWSDLERNFAASYEALSDEWRRAVVRQLRVPPSQRDPRLAPLIAESPGVPAVGYRPYRAPASLPAGEDAQQLRLMAPAQIVEAMPAEVRDTVKRNLKRIGAMPSLPKKEAAQSAMDAETRERIEGELAARRGKNGAKR